MLILSLLSLFFLNLIGLHLINKVKENIIFRVFALEGPFVMWWICTFHFCDSFQSRLWLWIWAGLVVVAAGSRYFSMLDDGSGGRTLTAFGQILKMCSSLLHFTGFSSATNLLLFSTVLYPLTATFLPLSLLCSSCSFFFILLWGRTHLKMGRSPMVTSIALLVWTVIQLYLVFSASAGLFILIPLINYHSIVCLVYLYMVTIEGILKPH